jgi:urease accessory protein
MAVADSSFSPVDLTSITSRPGCGSLAFRRCGRKTVLAAAFAASPLRLLTPRNHGDASWVFSTTLGGGLVDGDRIDLRVDMEAGTAALLATQASTKVYRSPSAAERPPTRPSGCVQHLDVRVGEGARLAIVPDPVVCFAGARYSQRVDVVLAEGASLVLLDAYSCGRAGRGERWHFDRLETRSTIARAGRPALADATLLDRAHGPIAERMAGFGAMATLLAVGPGFAPVRDAMLETRSAEGALAAASPVGDDAAVVRVAADRFESASRVLRSSFDALARVLGDDPFARKW